MSTSITNLQDMANEIKERIEQFTEAMSHAEADGNSDYDYYQGALEAYECVDSMLTVVIQSIVNSTFENAEIKEGN